MLQSQTPQEQRLVVHEMAEQPTAAQRVEAGKRYGDKAASAILKRAVELQQQETAGSSSGMSLAELERIAAEVGIDARHVQSAAMELETGGGLGRRFHILGGPLSVALERTVAGEVPKEQWDTLLQEIRKHFGHGGTPTQFGNTLEWTDGMGMIHVSISPRGGQTRISVAANFAGWAGGLFGGIVGGCSALVILPLFAPLPWMVNISVSAAIFAGLFGGTRALFRAITHKKTQKMNALLEQLAAAVAGMTT